MNPLPNNRFSNSIVSVAYTCRFFLIGLLLPLSFAPFHIPGMAIIALAMFYHLITSHRNTYPFLNGLLFGIGFFGFGISWIYISIHDYGHLHGVIAALITFSFLLYLSLFPALIAKFCSRFITNPCAIVSGLFFSALWTLGEYIRANFLTGFPWLLVGFGQFDSPVKHLMPILGIYSAGFLICFAATLLSSAARITKPIRHAYILASLLVIAFPLCFKNIHWAEENTHSMSVGVVQANLSMRDKWDETLFWDLIARYQQDTKGLLGTDLIVLPESAIPLPSIYVSDILGELHQAAKKAGSAVLFGIPQPTTFSEISFFNTLTGIGKAKGSYLKQHLVPFGEYIPEPFITISNWLGLPEATLSSGKRNQSLVKVHRHPIASLICYELGYGNILRHQLPEAEWIVSISDDGWFGRSLAMYQQLQMAQVLSLEAARYQVVANNDGLSSVIDTHGNIVDSLPAFSSGILKSLLYPASGTTPWVSFGDVPMLIFSLLIIMIFTVYSLLLRKETNSPIAAEEKRRYPNPL